MTRQTSKDPLKELQDIINQSNSFIKQFSQTPSEDVTMIMGITRSGKSTLVNYLIGNTLQAEYDEIESNIYLKIQEANVSGPTIGHGALSETTIPTRYESPYNGIIWDLPGFGDNKGSAQDITNAYFIRSLINHTKSCKLVLVVDYDTLNTVNVKLFIDLLAQVHSLFPTIIENTPGISIVFTKYEMNFRGRTAKEPKDVITSKLKAKIIDNDNLVIINHDPEANDKIRALVQYFVDHPDRICVLNRPANYDEIWKINADTPLVNTLQDINFIPTTALAGGFSLSPESSIILLNNYNMLKEMKGMKKIIQKIKGEYKNYFNKLQEDIKHGNAEKVGNEISKFKENFEKIFKPFKEIKQIGITKTLLELSAFSPECLNEVERSIIPSQENFIGFIQEILESRNRAAPITQTIYVKVQQSFASIQKELEIITIDLEVAKGEFTLAEAKELKKMVEQEAEAKASEQLKLVTELEELSKNTVTYLKTCKETMIAGTKAVVVYGVVGSAAATALVVASYGVIFLSPAVLAFGLYYGAAAGSVVGIAQGLSESHKEHQEIESKKQAKEQELTIKRQEKEESDSKLSQAEAEAKKHADDLEKRISEAEISRKALAQTQDSNEDDIIWGDDDTDYIDPNCVSRQDAQMYNPEGKGLSAHEQNGLQHNYWSIYSKEAMQQLLELRLEEANISQENKIKVISPNKSWDDSVELVEQIVLEIGSLMENTVLIPLNIYNKHWVGIVIEKTPGVVKISYMDPEQQAVPIMLQDKLTEFMGKEYFGYQVEFKEIQLEKQKYDNCGPEVIENFMLYLSGERFDQDTAVLNHSKMLEDKLAGRDKEGGRFADLDCNQEINISELPIDLLGNDFASIYEPHEF